MDKRSIAVVLLALIFASTVTGYAQELLVHNYADLLEVDKSTILNPNYAKLEQDNAGKKEEAGTYGGLCAYQGCVFPLITYAIVYNLKELYSDEQFREKEGLWENMVIGSSILAAYAGGYLGSKVGTPHVESGERQDERPRIHIGMIMLLETGTIGATLGVVPGAIYRWHGDSTRKKILIGNTAMAMGSALGSTLGVYLPGSIGNQTASFMVTLGSSILVSVPVLAVVLGDIIGDGLGVYLLSSLPPIGAFFGFIETYRYKLPPETALINVRDGQMSFAIPRIHFQTDCPDGGGLRQSVNLLRIRF